MAIHPEPSPPIGLKPSRDWNAYCQMNAFYAPVMERRPCFLMNFPGLQQHDPIFWQHLGSSGTDAEQQREIFCLLSAVQQPPGLSEI